MTVAPSTPSCPKPQMQRPTLLRSRVEGCKSKSETLTLPFPKLFKPEIDTNLLAFDLIQNALTEDAKDAGDDLFYESADDCLNETDEMDDDVLSLCGQSESEEEEGNLVDLAYDFAKNVVGQGITLDFTKVIQNAVHENIASSDFLEVDDFNDEELGGMEAGHFEEGADSVEAAQAQELVEDGLQSLRENAKQTLLRAAGDGSLFGALKAVEEARMHREEQVEALRREARDAMLKAASNGYLASALIKMRKVGQVSKVDKVEASENLVVENVKNVNVESSQLISYEVDLADQADQVSKYSEPVRENAAGTYTSTSRAVKLAWSMAGSPARSLRQKEARKLLHSREAGRPGLTAYPFSSERVGPHVTHNEKCKDTTEPSPSKSALTSAVGQPRLSGSASAMSLGLKRAKVVSVRCASRCASVGSLRPLKVKGPAPPAVPPTAFLQKQGN